METSDPHAVLAALTRIEQARFVSPEGARRHFQRFSVRGEAELRPMDHARIDQQPVAVQLRDVGLGGAGFLAPQPLAVDSLWHIVFGEQGITLGTRTVLIRHCRQVEEGLHLVGSQFCVDTGLLFLLGVSPLNIHSHLLELSQTTESFVPPGAVA